MAMAMMDTNRHVPHEPNLGGWLFVAGLSGALAVGFGAFGAHGLERVAEPAALAAYKTGALYHLIHSLALFGVAGLAAFDKDRARWPGRLFLVGIILFSGSLYVLGLTGSRALVLLTPVGGLCFIAGWLALALTGWRLGRSV